MKKTFQMEDLDCANCAAKMEKAISKIDGVRSVTVSFFAQKLILEGEDEKWDAIVKAAAEAVRRVDPDCRVIVK
ncbi:MAG: cation transporter [Clostridia bacterium]|nr:cation transporter [Clostridia bacterium]MBR2927357.1 cation transporter [Clostridia bacterium]